MQALIAVAHGVAIAVLLVTLYCAAVFFGG